jgi:hypothetical protein
MVVTSLRKGPSLRRTGTRHQRRPGGRVLCRPGGLGDYYPFLCAWHWREDPRTRGPPFPAAASPASRPAPFGGWLPGRFIKVVRRGEGPHVVRIRLHSALFGQMITLAIGVPKPCFRHADKLRSILVWASGGARRAGYITVGPRLHQVILMSSSFATPKSVNERSRLKRALTAVQQAR